MTRSTHTCPCGCGSQIGRRLFACKPGWYRLPKPYRDAIYDGQRQGARAHISAMRAAVLWFRDNAPTGVEG